MKSENLYLNASVSPIAEESTIFEGGVRIDLEA